MYEEELTDPSGPPGPNGPTLFEHVRERITIIPGPDTKWKIRFAVACWGVFVLLVVIFGMFVYVGTVGMAAVWGIGNPVCNFAWLIFLAGMFWFATSRVGVFAARKLGIVPEHVVVSRWPSKCLVCGNEDEEFTPTTKGTFFCKVCNCELTADGVAFGPGGVVLKTIVEGDTYDQE